MATLLLFDVDGTLAISTQKMKDPISNKLRELKEKGYLLGIVGGGNYKKITEQIEDNVDLFTYIFAENGITAYKENRLFHSNSLKIEWTESFINQIICYLLQLVIETELPFRRGNFIAFRQGMLYFTPVGSDCSWDERMEFVEYDKIHQTRQNLISKILNQFKGYNLDAKLGGMIGIGIHPKGWDKSYVVQFLHNYSDIYYFGDQYLQDGNDYPLLNHPRIKGVKVDNPNDTLEKINSLFK